MYSWSRPGCRPKPGSALQLMPACRQTCHTLEGGKKLYLGGTGLYWTILGIQGGGVALSGEASIAHNYLQDGVMEVQNLNYPKKLDI